MKGKKRKLGTLFLASALLLILTVIGCVAYAQRDQFLVHYHANRLVRGGNGFEDSERWLEERKILAVPVIIDVFVGNEEKPCATARDFLQRILAAHGDPTDPEQSHLSLSLAASLQAKFEHLSEYGRMASLSLAIQVLGQHLDAWSPNVPTALETGGKVLLLGLVDPVARVKEHALVSMAEIWSWSGADNVAYGLVEEWKRNCYDRASAQLASASPAIRIAAAGAISGSPYHEADAALIAMLDDEVSSVRKAALVALCASAGDSLTSSQKIRLMDFLHDPDGEVVSAASRLLQACGVSESRLGIAILMKHPDPQRRATIAESLPSMPEINPVPLLLTLSDDPSPMVRMSVVRIALESADTRLRARLRAMAETDPDANVRALLQQLLAVNAETKTAR